MKEQSSEDFQKLPHMDFINQLQKTEKLDLVILLSKIPVPIAILKQDGVFIGANQSFADIYESDALYLIGKNLNFFSITVFHLFEETIRAFQQNLQLDNLENEFYSSGHFFQIYFRAIREQNKTLKSIIIVCADITKLKRRERVLIQNNKRLYENLYTDPVTGLNNKLALEQFFKEKYQCQHRAKYSFLKLDLDNFKKYNQLNTYTLGDEVLSRIGALLNEELKPDPAQLYRLNSASFVVVIENSTPWKVLTVAERLRQKVIREHIQFEPNADEIISCSIGIFHPNVQLDLVQTEVLEQLDVAVQTAKTEGQNSIFVIE